MKCKKFKLTVNRKYINQALLWTIFLFICLIILKIITTYLKDSGYGLVVNKTTSLSQVAWWVNYNKRSNFQTGDYFVFYAPNDKMLTDGESTPVLKMVKGVSGDEIHFIKKSVYLDNKKIGWLVEETSKGHKLIPIESQVIQKGCYFAWTPSEWSYDSRYKDIGLVCESQNRIIGSATPLF